MLTFEWSRETVEANTPEHLEAAEVHIKTVRLAQERDVYPLGVPLSEDRIKRLADVVDAIGQHATRELGVAVAQLPPIDSDHIRFYETDDFAKLHPKVSDLTQMCNAFNTPCAYFIGVREREGPNGPMNTLTSAQHELIHHGGKRVYSLVKNSKTGLIDVANVSSGLASFAGNGKFSLLNEALVVALNREVRHTVWEQYDTLSPYADKLDEDEQDVLRTGRITKPFYYGLLFDYICEKASERTGEDAKTTLFAAHYSDSQIAFDSLNRAFGKDVVDSLAGMTQNTTRESILSKVAHKIGQEGEFCSFVDSHLERQRLAADY